MFIIKASYQHGYRNARMGCTFSDPDVKKWSDRTKHMSWTELQREIEVERKKQHGEEVRVKVKS